MKALGAAVVLLACLSCAHISVMEKRRTLSLLTSLCAALERMSAEMRSTLTPLPELLALCLPSGSDEADSFFRAALAGLKELDSRSFRQIWEETLNTQLPGLPAEDKYRLAALGAWLGRYPLEEQCAALARCLSGLRESRDRRVQALPQQSRLCYALSAAAGVFLMILVF